MISLLVTCHCYNYFCSPYFLNYFIQLVFVVVLIVMIILFLLLQLLNWFSLLCHCYNYNCCSFCYDYLTWLVWVFCFHYYYFPVTIAIKKLELIVISGWLSFLFFSRLANVWPDSNSKIGPQEVEICRYWQVSTSCVMLTLIVCNFEKYLHCLLVYRSSLSVKNIDLDT